ncbi:MAG: NCS2 family permease [Bacilli bacterium]
MNKFFKLDELNTNVRREALAGFTTFLAMAYILFVNPATLSLAGIEGVEGIPQGAVFVATALAAAVGSIMMGLYANYPIALAPGMGINAFFAFTVVLQYGIPWQTALAGTLVSGLLFILLTAAGIREKLINAIPATLKYAVAAGIGLFIAFIGFQNSGIIISNENVLVGLGDIKSPVTLLAIFGLVVTIILMARKIQAAIFIGMAVTSIAGIIIGQIDLPSAVISAPPSIGETFGVAIQNLPNVFTSEMLIVILTFFFVDFFDTAGTLVAVANQAGLMKDDKLPRANKALLADSMGTVVGAIFGTSTNTSYIESTAGVAVGGRSGLTAVFTGIFFLLALFFSPLLSVVTGAVTAPALIIVGILMVGALSNIKWNEFDEAAPAFFTIIMMPLAYSISTGIAVGFLFYGLVKVASGKAKEISPILWVMMLIFVFYFVTLPGH